MTPSLESLGIDRLDVDERIALAQAIWDSIGERPPAPLLTQAQREELDRRWADHLANPDDVVSWEEVKAEILRRYPSMAHDA